MLVHEENYIVLGVKISAQINSKQGWACKKYRNKAGMKYKKTILLQKNHGKERLEDYSTSVT